jgi:hypothetical protein
LCSSEVLAYADFNTQFILTTDASRVAVAAILIQVQDGVEKPVSYASRQLNQAEQNYSASELEMLGGVWASRHYRCYLYGRKFIVRTDHAALTFLHKFSGNNARLLRWSLRLAEYDFTVQHRPGAKIQHVDALSRHVRVVTTEPTVSKDTVRKEQATDSFCQTLNAEHANKGSELFRDSDGVIYKKRKSGDPLMVVHKSLVGNVISLHHSSVYAAHPGRKRTLDLISLRSWWPGMCTGVKNYVNKCDTCQRRNRKREFRAPLGEVTEPFQAFQIAHMDVVGPLPLSGNKNRYVITFVDKLTKYAEAIPLPEVSAVTCAKAYATQIVTRQGPSEILVTDRGGNFTSVFSMKRVRF